MSKQLTITLTDDEYEVYNAIKTLHSLAKGDVSISEVNQAWETIKPVFTDTKNVGLNLLHMFTRSSDTKAISSPINIANHPDNMPFTSVTVLNKP